MVVDYLIKTVNRDFQTQFDIVLVRILFSRTDE
jgi:hypothetical protein